MPNKQNLKRLHAALASAGLMDHKYAILEESYGVKSSKKLTDAQCKELTQRANDMRRKRYEASYAIRQHRSRVLELATKLGVYDPSIEVADLRFERFNKFMLDKRIAGKLMYELTEPELLKLIRKLRSMLRKLNDKRAAEQRQALLN